MVGLLERLCACCDHRQPVSTGGETVSGNLVASCFECNRKKSDASPQSFPLRDVPAGHKQLNWDGLSSLYPKLPDGDPSWLRELEKHGII